MFASALRRYVHHRTLEQLEQTLLHTLTAHVARDGGIIALTGNLINFINEYDTLFRSLHVIVGHLKQSGEDTLDVFSHIARLGEHRGIHDGEGHLEQFGNGTCQQCLTRTGTAHDDDIALLYLHLIGLVLLHEALVVVIHRYRQVSLGIVLAYHVLVEECLYLLGLGQLLQVEVASLATLFALLHRFAHNLMSLLGTFVADIPVYARDEHAHLGIRTSAKAAVLSLLLCHYFLTST